MCPGICSESIHNSVAKLHYLFLNKLKKAINIKMDIKRNYAIIKSYKSYIAVIILLLLVIKKHVLPHAYLILYSDLVESAHVRNNGSDHPSAIIE